jgi:hypothetical protein
MSLFMPDLSEVTENAPVPAGKYFTQIISAELGETGPNSKNPGSPQIVVSIAIPEEPTAASFRHWISLPNISDDERSARYKNLLFKRFLVTYGISANPGQPLEEIIETFPGHEAEVFLSYKEDSKVSADGSETVYKSNRLELPPIR